MAYVRISLMKPLPSQDEDVRRLNSEIVEYSKAQPGYVTGYSLHSQDESKEFCRITVWETVGDADRAANSSHMMSLRAELHLKVQEGHADRSFSE
jgi:quinol monooxygenase YgiN